MRKESASFITHSFFCFYLKFYLLHAIATKSIPMTNDSTLLNKETIQFYREYTGLNDAHDLERHLTAIQQKLAKVCIYISERESGKNTSMQLIEPTTSKGGLIIAAYNGSNLRSREFTSDSSIKI